MAIRVRVFMVVVGILVDASEADIEPLIEWIPLSDSAGRLRPVDARSSCDSSQPARSRMARGRREDLGNLTAGVTVTRIIS